MAGKLKKTRGKAAANKPAKKTQRAKTNKRRRS